MGSTKEKTFERLRKKRIWPAIVMFIGFATVCSFMVVVFVMFFATYIMGTKVEQMYDETLYISEFLEELTEKGGTLPQAVETLDTYMPRHGDVYIIDENGDVVVEEGSSKPNFDIYSMYSLSEDIVAIADSEQKDVKLNDTGDVFQILMREVFTGAMKEGKGYISDNEWLHETILEQKFWLETPLRNHEYQLYIKYTLQMQRQDVFYVCAFGVIAVIMLLIPLIFLFANTVGAIVTQQKVTKLLYLDMVTGGRNWFYFQNAAERILLRRRNRKKAYAIVELHLEKYQNYCACYGVKAGEELLESMDGFLRARMNRGEVHARQEGADFGLLLCCDGQNEQEYRDYCQKRMRSLLAELTGLRPGQKLHFHAGICIIYPSIAENGRYYVTRKNINVSQVYSYANTARIGTDCREEQRIAFFNQRMLDKQLWKRRVEENLETALRGEEFQVYLQPKYSPSDAEIVGAEALVRWKNRAGEIIQPNQFIPILEENGFVTQLDDYMVSHVAKMLSEWMIQGKKIVPVSINISRAHLAREGLAEHICRLVDAYGTKHEWIELEVKENAFFDDKDILIETIKKLKAYGFRVSMDDFGMGYSSLNSLKDMPLDALKLDTEFFHGEGDSERGEIIVREMVQLARSLNMSVVAEGIEKKEQVDFLTELGCDMIQGFYFAKPMPVLEFEEKMEKDA